MGLRQGCGVILIIQYAYGSGSWKLVNWELVVESTADHVYYALVADSVETYDTRAPKFG